jgi:putative ABC transport system permease protein
MGLGTLVWRNLWRRKLRTILTVGSLIVALFLLCTLRTLVTTLETGSGTASERRLWVQSAVSLFVDLPLSYEARIEGVDNVADAIKFQWFGGYYKEEQNQFAQFAVDARDAFRVYPEIQIVDGSQEAFLANRRGCMVGEGLVDTFGWKVGDTVPIIPMIFPHPDGPGVAWEFQVEAVYHPSHRYFDNRQFWFHWDYFEKTLEGGPTGTPGVGTYIAYVENPSDALAATAAIDQLFENGPQRVQTTTEAEFQKQFISMMGNVPFFVATIGGGVLIAILLAVVNTMLMAGREQTHDLGIMKALGFDDGAARMMLVAQSLFLCVLGGGLGLALAAVTEDGIAVGMGAIFPGYHVQAATYALGAVVTIALGVIAGVAPAVRAGRLRPVEALGMEE